MRPAWYTRSAIEMVRPTLRSSRPENGLRASSPRRSGDSPLQIGSGVGVRANPDHFYTHLYFVLMIAWYARIAPCVTAAVLWPGKVLSPTSHRPPIPAARG